jgi:single-stranded-DNA-specific exonuclease
MQTRPEIIQRQYDTGSHVLPANMHPVLKRIYLARGVTAVKEVENTLSHLLDYSNLKGIETATHLLAQHIEQDRRILVIGDYDADGATSCALAIKVMRAMGAQNVSYLVPNRFDYGYGLTPEIVDAAKSYQPELIITVDNGIASFEGVERAHQYGIKVLITDHHLPGNSLPSAEAIVNPNQPGDAFKSKNLAGVGVVFYLMTALRAWLRDRGWFDRTNRTIPNLAEYLDLVALGTIADVVKLDHNNRILVAQGLARIRAGLACPGIQALLSLAGRDYRQVTSMDMGFFVGPRLNAAGRLDDMRVGIECLLAESETTALVKARMLDQFNRERRQIEQGMREQASTQLDKLIAVSEADQLPSAICLYDESFHEGVIGILAGRIKEQTHRPTVVFAQSDNGLLKGSARSIPGLHIRDALDRLATTHPEVLQKFGGHAMAAGLSIEAKHFSAFNQLFSETVCELVDEDALQKVIHSDGALDGEQISLQVAEVLRDAGPWGQGFPQPVFDGRFKLLQRRIVGNDHLKMVLNVEGKYVDAIAFRATDSGWPETVDEVRLVYRLDINEFNGQRTAQLVVEYVEPVTD